MNKIIQVQFEPVRKDLLKEFAFYAFCICGRQKIVLTGEEINKVNLALVLNYLIRNDLVNLGKNRTYIPTSMGYKFSKKIIAMYEANKK